jgi:adenine-specific DNA-methyltransferase
MENINDYMPLSNDWNKERLETLKKMFPDLFTNEGKLNINELKKVVDPESVSETERYEFRWFGKSAAKRNAFSPSNATLVFDEARSVNPSETENLIIEGENLEVLKLLSTAYREKIKCIYIDPPYNTGKDFVYSDNYSQEKKAYWEDAGIVEEGLKIDTNAETDGRYHSNWLNMMYSRLLIARQLLREDGVIFISIDDIEITHLRKLCNEIFGEENFVSNLIWKSGRTAASHFTNEHEYILCFAKNKSELPLFKFEGEENISDRAIKRPSEKNPVSQISFPKGMDFECEDKIFPAEFGNGEPIKVITGVFEAKDGKLANDVALEAAWTMKDMIESWIDGETVIDQKGQIVKRFFFKDNGVLQYEKEKGTIHPKSIIVDYSTKNGTNALKALLGKPYFDFPKPPALLRHFYEVVADEEDIVLDFFAGSGSTGEAVLELNKEDLKYRKFILVQIPELTDKKSDAFKDGYKKISDITIDRNKRVVERIIEEKKKKQPDLFTNGKEDESIKNLGFKVFKLVKSNFPRVEFAPDPEKSTEENIELLKKYISEKEAQLISMFNEKELVTEVLIKNGFLLNYTLTKQEEFKKNKILFATDGEKDTLICLDILIDNETVEHFKKNTDKKFICLERALDTTKKWNLKHYLGDKFKAF